MRLEKKNGQFDLQSTSGFNKLPTYINSPGEEAVLFLVEFWSDPGGVEARAWKAIRSRGGRVHAICLARCP